MSTEAQKRASRKYYLSHKEYYSKKSNESTKRIRKERNDLIKRVEQLERIVFND